MITDTPPPAFRSACLPPPTADVNKKWSSGRKGAANLLLGQLVKGGKIKRAKVAMQLTPIALVVPA